MKKELWNYKIITNDNSILIPNIGDIILITNEKLVEIVDLVI